MYQTSPVENLKPQIGNGMSLCLTDDLAIAEMYLRGGLGVRHYVYQASWDAANLASEAELNGIVESLGWTMEDRFESQPYLAMKNAKVRAAVLAAGFDGAVYEDTHEGCNYETTELLREPEGFAWSLYRTVEPK